MPTREMLSDWMLKKRRQYIIEIKARLFSGIVKLSFKYKEPTHENCRNMNSHFYIDLFDELIRRNQNYRIDELLKAFKRLYIGEMEHDVSYKRLNDFALQKIHDAIDERKIKLELPDENTMHWDNS